MLALALVESPVPSLEMSSMSSVSNGQGPTGPQSGSNRFELIRTSGWYDPIDNPADPLPGRTQRLDYEGDEWDDVQPFYTTDIESIADLKSIHDETDSSLTITFTPGDHGLPTIEILDGDSEWVAGVGG